MDSASRGRGSRGLGVSDGDPQVAPSTVSPPRASWAAPISASVSPALCEQMGVAGDMTELSRAGLGWPGNLLQGRPLVFTGR